MRKGRAPKSIGSLLDGALKSHVLKKKVVEYAAFPHWPEIVGEEIARIAKPEKILSGRVLKVRVIDAVWAQELSLKKPELLERIQNFGKGAIIDDIRFTIGNPKSFQK